MPLKVRGAECSDKAEILHGPCPFMGAGEGRRRGRKMQGGDGEGAEMIFTFGNCETELAKVRAQSEHTLHPFRDRHIQAQFDLLLSLRTRLRFHPCPFACLFVGRLLS